MLAAEHFKHRIHTLATRQVFDRVLIVLMLVVDAMLQAEFADAREFLVGRGRPVHFDTQDLANLYGRGADSPCDRMN